MIFDATPQELFAAEEKPRKQRNNIRDREPKSIEEIVRLLGVEATKRDQDCPVCKAEGKFRLSNLEPSKLSGGCNKCKIGFKSAVGAAIAILDLEKPEAAKLVFEDRSSYGKSSDWKPSATPSSAIKSRESKADPYENCSPGEQTVEVRGQITSQSSVYLVCKSKGLPIDGVLKASPVDLRYKGQHCIGFQARKATTLEDYVYHFTGLGGKGVFVNRKDKDSGKWHYVAEKVYSSRTEFRDAMLTPDNSLQILKRAVPVPGLRAVKLEGLSDYLTAVKFFEHAPFPVIVFTNVAGARSWKTVGPPLMEHFRKLEPVGCYVVGDRDSAGVGGTIDWIKLFSGICPATHGVELPFPMKDTHGNDFKDWVLGDAASDRERSPLKWATDRTVDELLGLAVPASEFVAKYSKVPQLPADDENLDLPTGIQAGEDGTLEDFEVSPNSPASEDKEFAGKKTIVNYHMVETSKGGEEELVKEAHPLSIPIQAIQRRYNGFPKVCNGSLFIDNGGGNIATLKNTSSLFAWLRMKDKNVDWASGPTFATKEELFAGLLNECEQFREIQTQPHFPDPINGMYYACETPAAGSGGRIEEFLDYFSPDHPLDRQLILAAILTPAWSGPPGQRPAFAVTSVHGQGAGKTTFVAKIGAIYGGIFDFSAKGDFDKERTRLLSGDAIGKRIVLIDNIKATVFSSSNLEGMITASELSGHRMYVGEGARPNYFTYFLTMNGVSLSRDMAQRCVTISLGKAIRRGDWVSSIDTFIGQHRSELLADIRAFFDRVSNSLDDYNRWGAWQKEILCRLSEPEKIAALLYEREGSNDSDRELANELQENMVRELGKRGFHTDYSVHVPSKFIAAVLSEMAGEKVLTKASTQQILRFINSKLLFTVVQDPNHKHSRGFIWSDALGSITLEQQGSATVSQCDEKFRI